MKLLAIEKFKSLDKTDAIQVEVLNRSRGDYLVKYFESPFVAQKWTFNFYTGQWISWAHNEKPLDHREAFSK